MGRAMNVGRAGLVLRGTETKILEFELQSIIGFEGMVDIFDMRAGIWI
jgi:hypothetical protein